MNADAGNHTFFTGSAVHLARAPMEEGSGFPKSSATVFSRITEVLQRVHSLTVNLGWYPHILLMDSHISQVELGSPLDMALAATLLELKALLTPLMLLVALGILIPFGPLPLGPRMTDALLPGPT